MKKHFTAHIIFAATALASQQVWALGFGRAVSDAVLGQAFSFSVPVSVDPGEHFGYECVSAQVYYGDSQLLPTAVRTEVVSGSAGNTWIVRITASVPVAEPIVEVALTAGCDRRFTRRFSVFADPPTLGTTAAQLPQVAPLAQPSGASTADPAASSPVAGSAYTQAYATHRGASAAAGGRPRVLRKGPTMALANEVNAAPTARHAGDAGSARKPGPREASPRAEDSRLLLDPGVPHLKLDMEDPIIPPAAAASGASIALADLDDPDARRLKALEDSIQAIRHESKVQQDQTARLKAELAESQARNDWVPWLVGLLAIAAAGIAALAWKLRRQTRIAHSDWFNQSQLGSVPVSVRGADPATAMEPAPEPEAVAPALAPGAAAASDAVPKLQDVVDEVDARGMPAVVDYSATRPLDRQSMAASVVRDTTPRELSVEELLDLEQQADFFIALGQEDAAVDLLMSHLRSAGGQSPLPYTKLLEIYRRQGDRSAYERTRARFNRRFNAYAPDWDTGPASGRTLEDYPETVALLEAAWPAPIDAMALLEALLFKRDDTSELFDLPAYRDVLVLYSLARDLWQHGGGNAETAVDVLLPLDDWAQAAASANYPSAREVNELAMPEHDAGLDLQSVDVEGDTRSGMLTSFEMTGYDPGHGGGRVDFELPQNGEVHATLDELSLAPAAPTRAKPSPDWHEGDPPESELPTKR